MGYIKDAPQETYELRRDPFDHNIGKNNTAYIEWIDIKSGYWGKAYGHVLRPEFLKEAKIECTTM